MKKIKKMLSTLLALVMILTFVGPSVYAAGQTTVNIHKILMDETEFNKEDDSGNPVWPKEHNGQKLDLTFFGTGAKPINGVAFRIYEVYTGEDANPVGYTKGSELITSDKLSEGDLENDKFYKLHQVDNKDYVLTDKVGVEDGIAQVTLPDGTYRVVEDKVNSTYAGEGGATLTEMKAVPFDLTLPAGLPDGSGNYDDGDNPLHVYPKNIEKAPQVDKDFQPKGTTIGEGENQETVNLKATDPDKQTEVDGGAEVGENANNQRDKGMATVKIGDDVPYEIKTVIPANVKYATVAWSDHMTEGLTFNEDIKVKIGDYVAVEDTDYVVKMDDDAKGNTFIIELTETGRALVNDQANDTLVHITYSGKVNAKAQMSVPEANDVVFHFGNGSTYGNTPIPQKPSNGEITATKTFGDGDWAEGEEITLTLYDARTGEQVGESKTIKYSDPDKTATWTGLDNDKEYKVVEEFKAGHEATYTTNDDGTVTIVNKKGNSSINPSEPRVVVGGKKFVKTDDSAQGNDAKRLVGAEFIIQNNNDGDANKGKYLKMITPNEEAYGTAKKAYDDAIELVNAALKKGDISADNKVTIDGQSYETKDAALEKVNALFNTMEGEFVNANLSYEWVDEDQATKFYSDGEGKFEVKGLAYGSYQAVETKAPAGFALPANGGPFAFEVNDTSYTTDDKAIDYKPVEGADHTNDAMQITNSTVTIPQTGGMGTILFVIIGIALMAGATVAMKKRNAEA